MKRPLLVLCGVLLLAGTFLVGGCASCDHKQAAAPAAPVDHDPKNMH